MKPTYASVQQTAAPKPSMVPMQYSAVSYEPRSVPSTPQNSNSNSIKNSNGSASSTPAESSSRGWGFFEGVKKLAKDATTALLQYEEEDPSEENLNTSNSSLGHWSESTELGGFEIVEQTTKPPLIDPDRVLYAKQTVHKQGRGPPLLISEWINSFGPGGVLHNVPQLRGRIYLGGMEPSLRPEVWKYLLGYYPTDSSLQERELIKQQRELEYKIYMGQWQTITPEQESHFTKFRSLKERIDKDVVRTDRSHPFYESDKSPHLTELYRILLTYAFFNFDIGYVQGMNDLVSILLVVMDDEVDAFWCFKGLMDRIMDNFDKDQVGMHTKLTQLSEIVKYTDHELYAHLERISGTNMFFCFRWLLIMFKREFAREDVERIWEVMWADYYGPHHHLFVCLAMLLSIRDPIIEQKLEFDDILRFVNEQSKKMNHEEILINADYLYRKFMVLCENSAKVFAIRSNPTPTKRRK